MSQLPVGVLGDLYTASGRGDMPSVLATVGDDIVWNAP
jgi:ketosteroid isomerase-like protein